jgi:hypothetical protein
MNPMRAIKLIVRELIVDSERLWRAASFIAGYAVLGLSLAGNQLIAAQEPGASTQTNDASAAQVLSQLDDLMRSGDSTPAEDMAPADDLMPTNGVPQLDSLASSGGSTGKVNRFDASSRAQSDDRKSRGRRSPRTRSSQRGGSGSANNYSRDSNGGQGNSLSGTNNGAAALDYAAFKVIVDRNIFDPNRYPHRPGVQPVVTKPKSVDSVTLVGIISYEKGTFAFFDGTSSEYKKALKLTDSIAGYKVTNIAPNAVKLASGTNELELRVGAQMRREDDGPWLLAGQSAPYLSAFGSTSAGAAAATTTTGSGAASGGADSDIIKKLMQRREKE